MTNKKELNQEELEKVSGGANYKPDRLQELKAIYNTKIDKYETENHLNENVLLIEDSDETWYYGTLIASYEKTHTCTQTLRVCKIQLIESSYLMGFRSGSIEEILLDHTSCYISLSGGRNTEALVPGT